MVAEGETGTLPLVAPPVEKPTPAQEVALVEDQVRVEDWPRLIVVGLAESVAVGVATPITDNDAVVDMPAKLASAVMVTDPARTPVAMPLEPIVAIELSEEDQTFP